MDLNACFDWAAGDLPGRGSGSGEGENRERPPTPRTYIEQIICFWPRERLLHKLRLMLLKFRQTKLCTPAQAAKFRGTAQFTAHASHANAAEFGMGSFKQRQQYDTELWDTSLTMDSSTRYFDALVSDWPKRVVKMCGGAKPPLIIISDAQADPGSQPSGGVIAIDMIDNFAEGYFTIFEEDFVNLSPPLPLFKRTQYPHERGPLRRGNWVLNRGGK